jgi:hypothetical protein
MAMVSFWVSAMLRAMPKVAQGQDMVRRRVTGS